MIKKESIDEFMAQEHIAIAGVSRNPKKFGNAILRELKKKGHEVYPVNLNSDEIEGIKCFRDISLLPDEVTAIIVVTKKTNSADIVRNSVSKGIRNIWIQQMSDTPEAIEAGSKQGINLISKQCVMMYADPVTGIHNFHRSIKKLVGKYPK